MATGWEYIGTTSRLENRIPLIHMPKMMFQVICPPHDSQRYRTIPGYKALLGKCVERETLQGTSSLVVVLSLRALTAGTVFCQFGAKKKLLRTLDPAPVSKKFTTVRYVFRLWLPRNGGLDIITSETTKTRTSASSIRWGALVRCIHI